MQTFNTKSNIAVYYELTKPKIWYLLVFTAFGAAITASNVFNVPISLETWALLLGGVAAGSAAANTLTNYHDRDIDAIMERTKGRPIPSRRIYPAEKARNFGLVLAAISLACAFGICFTASFWQGILAGSFMAFGLIDNILVYSKDDYQKVNVPMLTAVQSEKTSARIIAGTTLMMVLFSVVPFFLTHDNGEPLMHEVYLYTAIASGVLMVVLSFWVVAKPSEKASWVLFKFSSPYLAVLFIALMVDSVL